MSETLSCDDCDGIVSDALVRTVRLTVDRSHVDQLELCPTCFADWIEQYDAEMALDEPDAATEPDEIIVD